VTCTVPNELLLYPNAVNNLGGNQCA
jgi:hypothetical protein